MKTIAFKWQTIGLLGFFALMTMGVFAQTAQPTDAHYVNPMTCNQLWNACERQRDMGIRPRACTMHATLCGWMEASSSSQNSCGPSTILCPPNRMPECSGGRWKCVMAGASSSSSIGANCANTSVLCIEGTMPQCINDQWRCLPASSSASSDRCIARCADGYEYRTCTEDGHPINYFVDPCFNHSSSSSSLPSATLCEENLCGPRPGMPNWICPDGNSYGGPSGRCVRAPGGACSWEILSCPASSSTSSVSTSTSSIFRPGCYCPRIYAPVCGADGRTYSNSCEAGCANANIVSQGACGVDPITPQCPVYSLIAPGPGCHYEYTKNERGCDVPNLVCASSSSSQMTCGPSNIRCRQGFEPSCSNGMWKCVRGSSSSSSSACAMIDMAAPPRGCRYEGCRFDSNGCYQGGCRLMCSSSSTPAPSSCGPSTVLCAPNTNPVCSGGQWRCVPNGSSSSVSSKPAAQNGCKVAGCSGQLCVEEGSDGISTCEYREEYACYRTARCERQATGVCGWTQTQELRSCIANARS